jgi:hypothetical protein
MNALQRTVAGISMNQGLPYTISQPEFKSSQITSFCRAAVKVDIFGQ